MYDENMNKETNVNSMNPNEGATQVNDNLNERMAQASDSQSEYTAQTNDNLNESMAQASDSQSDSTAQAAVYQNESSMQSQDGQSGNSAQEGQEYRYGRNYYENRQDSVYHTNEQRYQAGGQHAFSNGNQPVNRQVSSGHKGWKTAVKALACVAVVAAVGIGSALGSVYVYDRANSGVLERGTAETNSSARAKNERNADTHISTVSASTAVVTDVSDVVENTMPSVVKITNMGTQTYNGFFGQGGTYEYESNGSGIIIGQTEEELLIATNQHVVSGAEKLQVIFIDEESCEANVKGTDAQKDLAVIAVPINSIKKDTLDQIKVATLGDSDNLKVGEPAIAIGNALGYGQSVTLGVISAKDREVTTENSSNKLIQTDAAINPGNSGGALLNIAGEVIGINSVKYSSTEVEGMGYAIPISDATPIINELMNKETKTKVDDAEQSYMGIYGLDINRDVAQAYNMPKGVYVTQVTKDGPAERAGIKKGDIITKIGDVSVTSFDDLEAELEYHAAGTTVQVELLSQAKNSYGYETKIIDVTLAKREN